MATLRLFTAVEGEATRTRYHFRYRVQLDGVFYRLEFHYSSRADLWTIDVRDDSDAALVSGLGLVLSGDLLAQFRHLPVPAGSIAVIDSSGGNLDAGRDDLGIRVVVEYTEDA